MKKVIRCKRCRRELINLVYVERGYGKVCWDKEHPERKKRTRVKSVKWVFDEDQLPLFTVEVEP